MSEAPERDQNQSAEVEPKRPGFFARLFGRRRAEEAEQVETPEPIAVAEEAIAAELTVESPAIVAPEPDAPLTVSDERVLEVEAPEPEAVEDEPVEGEAADEDVDLDEPAFDDVHVAAVLERVLDDLGAAHHRPFSRG